MTMTRKNSFRIFVKNNKTARLLWQTIKLNVTISPCPISAILFRPIRQTEI